MRDLVSCFSENSINVTHPLSSSLSLSSSSSSCSKYNTSKACISPSLMPSIQTSITSIYRISLPSSKHLIIKVTWCNKNNNNNNNPQFNNNGGLSISVSSADQNPSTSLKLNTSSRFFRKKKGNKSVDSDLGKIEAFWDLSSAKYDSNNNLSPEPIQSFYVVVLVDSQLGLFLGDSSEETLRKKGFDFDFDSEKSLVSRQEHFSGNSFYSTKAKFVESGDSHEIVIRCNAEKTEGLKQSNHHHHHSPVLSVCIDKKTVTKVKRLQWNFRGNQTIFVDGLLVDLMWDVHDWFFSNPEGCGKAVFMFRTRNGLDSSRLWLEEKMVQKDEQDKDKLDFSLLIYACKT